MKQIKWPFLFIIGGALYGFIEVIWRGHTHPTMLLLGGALFVLLGGINEFLEWEMPLWLQAVIGAIIVTEAELFAGMFLNMALGLNIWDYSNMPLNLYGQICLPFSIAWIGLSVVAIVLDDWLRYWLWGEERPHYKLF